MTNKEVRFPLTVGGRDIDISQIGYSLQHELREYFPINQVPEHLVKESYNLISLLEKAEKNIENFILSVRITAEDDSFMDE